MTTSLLAIALAFVTLAAEESSPDADFLLVDATVAVLPGSTRPIQVDLREVTLEQGLRTILAGSRVQPRLEDNCGGVSIQSFAFRGTMATALREIQSTYRLEFAFDRVRSELRVACSRPKAR